MNTVTIDGVEYEQESSWFSIEGTKFIKLRACPPKRKTIVQVAAEAMGEDERDYRRKDFVCVSIYDHIEQRLQALEAKVGK